MKSKKTVITLSVLVVLLIILIGGTVFMFNFSLASQTSATDEEDSYAYLFEHTYMKEWVDSLHHHSALKDTFILAEDGAKLHALYVKSAEESPNTALIIHGYTDNSIRMLMIGHLYNKVLGYNILLPDLRGHGKSDGEYIQMGWKDRLDILQWIDVTTQLYGDTTRMVLHGISMGAATTMMTSGEELPDNIKCFVEDCGYTSVWDEFAHKLKAEYGLPAFPLMHTTSLYCKMKNGWGFKEATALEQVKKCNRPMFFIHGGNDTYVPTQMVYPLYEAKPGEKELWVIPEVEHADAYWDHTEEYVDRTRNFVSKYMH
ncbi:alpha/beta hydrolase [Bacteroides sp. 224]|uniref:alpha/beta hydrolase n=1 Tax=Bacteroides sp. 224 TaxID=2302936 RepID=UPI0013CF5783|nr:alpha/beta hydrolase [Bacteroides sp. 224]NDV64178.1 alpha/beta hydrolase [Bacteroides sp. 224]